MNDSQLVRLIPEQICRDFTMLPIGMRGDDVEVVIAHENELARSVAERSVGKKVVFKTATEAQVREVIDSVFVKKYSTEKIAEIEAIVEAQHEETHTGPVRIGDLLLTKGLISETQLEAALREQARTGSRLGDILVHSSIITEKALLSVLADQYQIPATDLTDFDPDPEIARLLDEPLAKYYHAMPIARDEHSVYVAVVDRLEEAQFAELRSAMNLDERITIIELLVTSNSLSELMQRVYSVEYSHTARMKLLEVAPENSANVVITGGQKAFFIGFIILAIVCGIFFFKATLIVLISLCSIFYLASSIYKVHLTFNALGHQYETDVTDEEIAALDEADLPVYTILIPLYREAAVVPALVDGIGNLDYPKTKLDVKLLCEEDDDETIPAILALNLPPHFKLVVVPDSLPKTKPKACNYGLLQAEGKYVVIYDAEDRPDPDQLKKAIIAFDKSEDNVTCIQAKLNYFNQDQNMLTRWFSAEYSMWFDLMLPGLDKDGVPIPLGGTSNHFVTERLIELGCWDPFNVTEDADLGIRLHKAGYTTSIIDSTTLEEANSDVHNWIRQRSRWIKGYIQTWLVHMRRPGELLNTIGLKSFISFNLVVGGVFIFLLNPIFWTLTTVFFFTHWDFIRDLFPSFIFYVSAAMLFIGNFIFIYFNVAGSLQRGYFHLTKYALLSPIYWGLMSWAAWKGFIQLFTNPFYWEKTIHGLDGTHASQTLPPKANAPTNTTMNQGDDK